MLTSLIVRIVDRSIRHPWRVIFAALLLSVAGAAYVATHFAINTDINGLIDTHKPWAERDHALDAAFPQRSEVTLAVVQAPAPELADQAATELAAQLARDPQWFRSVQQPSGGAFFTQNGLLYLSNTQVSDLTSKLVQARPLLSNLAHDPSLRGLANLLSVTLLVPLQSGKIKLADMATLLGRSADTIDAVLAGRPAALSWRALVGADTGDTPVAGRPAHSFVVVHPVLNYSALEPGLAASNQIRRAAVELQLAKRYGATVRLTGARPLSDEEFASVADGAVVNAIGTLVAVLAILWFALRSIRMVVAVFVTLIAGLIVTTALGLLMVGALNLISVAFAVLFVGIGVDFGIQFGVRYRSERHDLDDLRGALLKAAKGIALPLSLAAAATAASFLSFLPTAYRGISELGQIAGVGILCVAFPSCLTLLPALIAVLKPPGEPAAPGFKWLTPIDQLFERQRKPIIIGTLGLVLAGLPLLAHLDFDFNPLHLKNAQTESMRTLSSLDPSDTGINDIKLLTPSPAAAQLAVTKLEAVPEVGRVVSLASFVPADQALKLPLIEAAAAQLLPALSQPPAAAATDAIRVSSLRNAALQLDNAALDYPGAGAQEAQHLAASMRKLAGADTAARDRAEQAIALPLRLSLQSLQQALMPQPVSLQTLPPELVHQWLSADGQALVQISPRIPPGADPNDDALLRRFTDAVLRAEPDATGGPVSVLASARTIITSFIQATLYAVLAITLLLWLALRRFHDVLRTLVPLVVSAAVTLELCVLFGIPLNFANIIALPLLLGIGVAFKIYYVLAWRSGQTGLLQSGLTQAIVLSAATTGTAFGSLWLSHHPGTASMGRLLALSLLCTLIGAVFFQPVLMGRPRQLR